MQELTADEREKLITLLRELKDLTSSRSTFELASSLLSKLDPTSPENVAKNSYSYLTS